MFLHAFVECRAGESHHTHRQAGHDWALRLAVNRQPNISRVLSPDAVKPQRSQQAITPRGTRLLTPTMV